MSNVKEVAHNLTHEAKTVQRAAAESRKDRENRGDVMPRSLRETREKKRREREKRWEEKRGIEKLICYP